MCSGKISLDNVVSVYISFILLLVDRIMFCDAWLDWSVVQCCSPTVVAASATVEPTPGTDGACFIERKTASV